MWSEPQAVAAISRVGITVALKPLVADVGASVCKSGIIVVLVGDGATNKHTHTHTPDNGDLHHYPIHRRRDKIRDISLK